LNRSDPLELFDPGRGRAHSTGSGGVSSWPCRSPDYDSMAPQAAWATSPGVPPGIPAWSG
jgi:hypothetical protein